MVPVLMGYQNGVQIGRGDPYRLQTTGYFRGTETTVDKEPGLFRGEIEGVTLAAAG